MRAVVQRVSRASVTVDDRVVGEIGVGLLVLVAAHRDDTEQNAIKMADRIAKLRIFNDSEGKMNLALADLGSRDSDRGRTREPRSQGSVLAVSNFTIYGETAKNRRPSFIESAPYERGKELYEQFVEALRALGVHTETGVFGAMMDVELVNDGPVTVIIDA